MLYKNLIDDAKLITGQDNIPAFYVYQTSGVYVGWASKNTLPVQRAQIDFVDQTDGAFWIGPSFPYPNPDNHMYANSYRWFGSHAAMIAFRVINDLNVKTFRIRDAHYNGHTLQVGINTPTPPLQIKPFYHGSQLYEFSSLGFTIKDDVGELFNNAFIAKVIGPDLIELYPKRLLKGKISINLGDYHHRGGHNVSDSSFTKSIFRWEYFGDLGQSEKENIPELLMQHYILNNWCALDSFNVTDNNQKYIDK